MNLKLLPTLVLLLLLIDQAEVLSPDIGNPSCGIALNLQSFIFLDKFCSDCYNIYRLEEVYQECREECYDNDFFFFCLNVTLVKQETATKAEDIIRGIAEPRLGEIDFLT